MKKFIILILLVLSIGLGYCLPYKVSAFQIGVGEFKTEISDPDVPYKDLNTAIGSVVSAIITVAEIAFIILLLIGGVMYLTSMGNEEQAGKARKLIIEAIVGLVIVLAAWAISTWIIGRLKNEGGGGGTPVNGGQDTMNESLPAPHNETLEEAVQNLEPEVDL